MSLSCAWLWEAVVGGERVGVWGSFRVLECPPASSGEGGRSAPLVLSGVQGGLLSSAVLEGLQLVLISVKAPVM